MAVLLYCGNHAFNIGNCVYCSSHLNVTICIIFLASFGKDSDFPHSKVSDYADDIIDAIYDMIDAHPDQDEDAENDLKSALTAALVAVVDEVEESLEDIEYGMNNDMKDLEKGLMILKIKLGFERSRLH